MCQCKHDFLWDAVQDGIPDEVQECVQHIQECASETHNRDISVKEKLYKTAHAKNFACIQILLQSEYMSIEDYLFAVFHQDCYQHLKVLAETFPNDYLRVLRSLVSYDDDCRLPILIEYVSKDIQETLLAEAHPCFVETLRTMIANVSKPQS